MKKVVIVTRQMIMGGIEKSLISMLESMSQEQYNVTVLVMAKGGDLFNEIPKGIKVRCIYGDENTTIEKIWNSIKKMNIWHAIKIIYYTLMNKVTKSNYKREIYQMSMMNRDEENYDIAIAYHVPASLPVIYVLNHIKSKYKYAWIHSDVTFYKK